MASNGKKKTTMAKLNREHKVREKQMLKKARREARKLAAGDPAAVAADEPVGPRSHLEPDPLDRYSPADFDVPARA